MKIILFLVFILAGTVQAQWPEGAWETEQGGSSTVNNNYE